MKYRGWFYVAAGVGLLAMNPRPTGLFMVVHMALIALGVALIVKQLNRT
jgi:hypothetical protein